MRPSDSFEKAGSQESERMRSPARPLPDLSDADAVSRARDGDHEAFRVLVERYQGRAYRLAARLLRDPDLARDAVQEGFLKAYGSLARFEGRSAFYTWLYRLVFNLCIDMKRRDRSRRHVAWDDEVARQVSPAAEAAPSEAPKPGEAFDRVELRAALAEAIEQLPEDARRTLLLREVDGLSYAEIAEALDIPKGTVMSRLHHARRRVRELLVEAGAVELEPAQDGRGAA
jgi:RNA polymerase sigma-70 factor (ECF subfamily)